MGKKPKTKYRVLSLAETSPTVHSSSKNSSAVTSTSNFSVSAVGPKNDSMESSSPRFKSEVTAERPKREYQKSSEADLKRSKSPRENCSKIVKSDVHKSTDESASVSTPELNYQCSNSSGRRASLKSDNYGDDSSSQSKDERRHNNQKRNESKDLERDYNTRSSRNTEEDISNAERPSIDESASCSMPKDNYQLSNSSGRRASLKSDNYGDDSPSQSKDERRHNDQKRNESKDPERDYNTRSSRNTEEDISNAERPSIDESASWSKAKDNYQCSNSSGRRASLKSDNNGDDSSSQSRDERRHSDRRPNDNTRSSRNKCFKEDISNSERPSRNKDGKTGDGKDANKSQRQKSPYQKLPKNDFSPIVDSVKNKVERVGKAVFEFIDGDLFHTADDFSLAHCVGEDMAMGAGIAVAFRKKFHKVGFLLDQQVKTGGVAVLEAPPRFVYYLVTKRLSTGKPTMSSLKSSVEKMKDHIVKNGVKKLALPELGSGLDRLDWDSVLEFLKKLFSDVEIHIQIYHYVPGNKPQPPEYGNKVVKVGKDLVRIEEGTALIYIGSVTDKITDSMKSLNTKHNFIDNYLKVKKEPGQVIQYIGTNDVTYGFICVDEDGRFSYEMFDACVAEFIKLNKVDQYIYMGISSVASPQDYSIMLKIENLVKYNRNLSIEIWICDPILFKCDSYDILNFQPHEVTHERDRGNNQDQWRKPERFYENRPSSSNMRR